jgi:hypothetical protein
MSALMQLDAAPCTAGHKPLMHGASASMLSRGVESQVLHVVHWPCATSMEHLPSE